MSDRLAQDYDSFHMIFHGIQQSAIQVRENNHENRLSISKRTSWWYW